MTNEKLVSPAEQATTSRTGVSRRSFVQATAAAALAAGATSRGIRRTSAKQDKTVVKFWTHTHPPMVEQNEAAIESSSQPTRTSRSSTKSSRT